MKAFLIFGFFVIAAVILVGEAKPGHYSDEDDDDDDVSYDDGYQHGQTSWPVKEGDRDDGDDGDDDVNSVRFQYANAKGSRSKPTNKKTTKKPKPTTRPTTRTTTRTTTRPTTTRTTTRPTTTSRTTTRTTSKPTRTPRPTQKPSISINITIGVETHEAQIPRLFGELDQSRQLEYQQQFQEENDEICISKQRVGACPSGRRALGSQSLWAPMVCASDYDEDFIGYVEEIENGHDADVDYYPITRNELYWVPTACE